MECPRCGIVFEKFEQRTAAAASTARSLGAHRLGLVMMMGALLWGAIYLAKNREAPSEPVLNW